MGAIQHFEDFEIWKLARELVNLIYTDFNDCKDFNFRNQITSAGLSIKNNIAEGFSRESDKEFKHFLNISKGSSGEVKSMYYTAEDLQYVSLQTASERRNRTSVLIIKITNFMYYLKSKKLNDQTDVTKRQTAKH